MENNFYETESQVPTTKPMREQWTRKKTQVVPTELFRMAELIPSFGLLVSFGVAFFLVYTIPGYALFRRLVIMTSGYLPMILLVAQLLLSLGMSSAIRKSSVGTTWASRKLA